MDLDICYAREGNNLIRLAGVLRPVKPPASAAIPAGLPFRFHVETLKRGLNFTLTTDAGDIDLIGEVAGVGDYAEVATASMPVDLLGRQYAVLAPDSRSSPRAGGLMGFPCAASSGS